MTKEITRAVILQEMQDKLKLREFEHANFLFAETVLPVYDIEQHLEEWWNLYTTMSISGMGGVTFFTIPKDERWQVKRYDVVFITGVYTVSGVYISRINCSPAGAIAYLDLKAAQSVSYHTETDVVLGPGDSLKINIDGYTSPGDLRMYIDYSVEKLR